MKVFAVLLVALCAFSLVFARNPHQSSHSGDQHSDYDGGVQGWEEEEWQKSGSHQQGHGSLSSDSETNSDDPLASDWADVVPFRTKITQRLGNSEPLSNQPKIKEKIIKFLEDKVEVCKVPGAGKNKVNKQCMGRLTGQIMQMIAAFEKGSQDMPGSYDW